MIDFVVKRYRWSKLKFPAADPRHGLIWGSPEADNGDPANDFPNRTLITIRMRCGSGEG